MTKGWLVRRARWLTVITAALSVCVGFAVSDIASGASRTLVSLQDDIPAGLDIDGASSAEQSTQQVIQNLMEPLLAYPTQRNSAGVLIPNYKVTPSQFAPRLATSWTQKGLVWTFHLRHGVKSCAGNTFTANDVIWTYERAMSVSGASPIAWFLGNTASVLPVAPLLPNAPPSAKKLHGEVKKINNYTVQFTQSGPNELFPRMLEIFGSYIYDSKEMMKHATSSDPWAHTWNDTTNAPGFGPYCLTSWTKGSSMTLTANKSYYRGQPQFQTVVIRKVPADANRVAAIESGGADIATNLTPQEYDQLSHSGKVTVVKYWNTQDTWMGLNYVAAPWNVPNNRLIRQAVAYALPYQQIDTADYAGTGRRWYSPCASDSYGYVGVKKYNTDLQKARALLAQAGYPGGKGLPTAGLTLYYPSERQAILEPLANRISTALAQIGMHITLAPVPQAVFSNRAFSKRDLPMFLSDVDRPLGPDVGYCSKTVFLSAAKGGLTPINYSNPTFDTAYFKSAATVGKPRIVYLHAMQKILMRDLPVIPIAEVESQVAVRKGITNWTGTVEDIPYFWSLKSK